VGIWGVVVSAGDWPIFAPHAVQKAAAEFEEVPQLVQNAIVSPVAPVAGD
jgi:hypothetical protein